jgi:preprotein translocase subunit YajC
LAQEFIIDVSAVLIVIAAAYLALIKPQLNRLRESSKLLSSLSIGDTIVTSGGIIGVITRLDGADRAEIQVSEGVRVGIIRSCIETRLS